MEKWIGWCELNLDLYISRSVLHHTLHHQNCSAYHYVVPYVPNGKGSAKKICPFALREGIYGE